MKIYIYGGNSFKKHMKKILLEARLSNNIQDINEVHILEQTIKNDKLSIYLIDSDKIINKNIITEKLNFLKPKDAIYKHLLVEAGIDDMCFNSDESLIEYMKAKIEDNIQEDDQNTIQIQEEERNMADITQIDEIFEDDLLTALDTEISQTTKIEDTNNEINTSEISNNEEESEDSTNSNELQINSSNIDDVTSLIKELLNNKTLELSIKIKAS